MSALLEVRNVSLSFKGVKAISDLSFSVRRGEICALIGPNGAGKSSLLNILNGVYRADAGQLFFATEPLRRPHPLQAAQALVWIFQRPVTQTPSPTVWWRQAGIDFARQRLDPRSGQQQPGRGDFATVATSRLARFREG